MTLKNRMTTPIGKLTGWRPNVKPSAQPFLPGTLPPSFKAPTEAFAKLLRGESVTLDDLEPLQVARSFTLYGEKRSRALSWIDSTMRRMARRTTELAIVYELAHNSLSAGKCILVGFGAKGARFILDCESPSEALLQIEAMHPYFTDVLQLHTLFAGSDKTLDSYRRLKRSAYVFKHEPTLIYPLSSRPNSSHVKNTRDDQGSVDLTYKWALETFYPISKELRRYYAGLRK